MPTYQTTNPRAVANPLRSISLLRPASEVLRKPLAPYTFQAIYTPVDPDWRPAPVPVTTEAQAAQRALASAEASLREAVRCYDAARAGIGEANRTSLAPLVVAGRAVMAAARLSPERIRQRKSAAFRLMNQRRHELNRDRRAVDVARAALGLPLLAETEERVAVQLAVRAGKRRPATNPIAQNASAF